MMSVVTVDLEAALRAAAVRHVEAQAAAADAEDERARLVREALGAGFSLRRVAALVGVSHQRVAQIAGRG